MKGIVCEQPYQFKLEEMEVPVLQSGQALVRVRRIGICGTDLHAYRGQQPFFQYPRILGHELSGEIAQVGDQVEHLKIGDKVAIIPYLHCGSCIACRQGKTNCCTQMEVLGVHCDGGMREYITVPSTHLIPVNHLSLDQIALVEPLTIGAHAVHRAELSKGETVLVIGSGPIGLGVMKFAKIAGATVIAMDMNEQRLQFCQTWAGADHLVHALNDPLAELEKITDGDFPSIVFDATGNAQSMTNAFNYVSHGGKVVYVGLVKADISFHDPDFHKKEISLLASRNSTRQDFEYVLACMEKGWIDADRYITHRSSFDQMIAHYESWLKPETGVIKALVEL